MNGSIMQTQYKDYTRICLPIAILFLLSVVFYFPVLSQGKTFYAFDALYGYLPWASERPGINPHNTLITDPINASYPYYHFIQDHVGLKTAAFWNGSNFCGVPIAPMGGNPLEFLCYRLLSLSAAHDLYLWFNLMGAGLFMLLYLKQIRLHPLAALIGAVAWMFNGYVMVWFEFQNVVIVAAAFPATLFFMELWLKTGKKSHFVYLIGAVCYTISSAYAHLIIYQFLFIGSYFIYRTLSLKKKTADFRFMSKIKASVVCLSIVLVISTSSAFVLSHLSFLEDPQRTKFSFEELKQSTGILPAKYLVTLVFPDFFGSPVEGNISFPPRMPNAQPYNNYNELCVYAGIVPLLLLLSVCPFIFRIGDARFYLFAGLIALSMAMGSAFYYPLYKFIPGLSFSTPTRILYLFGFCVSALSAIGADLLLRIEAEKKRMILVLWVLLGLTAIGVALWVQTEAGAKWFAGASTQGNWHLKGHIIQNHFALTPIVLKPLLWVFLSVMGLSGVLFAKTQKSKSLWLLLSIGILSSNLVSFGCDYNTASPRALEFPETEAIRFLKKDRSVYRIMTAGRFMHNTFEPFNIQDAGGYASLYPRRYAEYIHLSQFGPDFPFPESFSRWIQCRRFGSPLLDLINIKYVLVPPSVFVEFESLKLVYTGEINIYENTNSFPRAFFVTGYQFCDSRQSAYQTIASYDADAFKKKVVLETMPPVEFRQPGDGEHGSEPDIRFISYEPGHMEIRVSTDRKGFLVLADNYHPAWEVKVDGKVGRILHANYIMRAIPIERGDHAVSLQFNPPFLYGGMIFTAVGWIVLGTMISFLLFREIAEIQMRNYHKSNGKAVYSVEGTVNLD
jgi:hypothetical protein